jgi:hypothetical protein
MWISAKNLEKKKIEYYNMSRALLLRVEPDHKGSRTYWRVTLILGDKDDWYNVISLGSFESKEEAHELAADVLKAVGGAYFIQVP